MGFARLSQLLNERSSFSPNGPIIWPFKFIIPITGVMMLMQGIVESIRCVICLRDGEWPQRLSDVEEMEKLILEQAEAEKARGESRSLPPQPPAPESETMIATLFSGPGMGVIMLVLFLVFLMLGFPIAFTLMALGVGFGLLRDGRRIFQLLVQRDLFDDGERRPVVDTALPFHGLRHRAANILDRLFHSIQLALGWVPAPSPWPPSSRAPSSRPATGIVAR